MVKIIKKTKEVYRWDKTFSREILNIAKKDWKKAVQIKEKTEYMRDYVLNEKVRGKLAEFMGVELNISGGSKVLDVGTGMGALTVALARRFDVFSADTNPYTLKFVKYRAEQENVDLKLYQIPQLPVKIPFKNGYFDVVILNGVLEWVGKGAKGDVKDIQMEVLKDVYGLVKDKGYFILAIENRIAFDWFKGKTSHENIMFADLMPRWLANVICKKKKGYERFKILYCLPNISKT